MNLTQFIKNTTKVENPYMTVRPVIVCNDGFQMSVQASSGHYCYPRINAGVYEKLEIGFPSEEESLIIEYAEEKESPTQTVYGWVPCDIIDEVIKKHGGINELKTFKNK